MTLLCVGNKMPVWVEQGFYNYAKRIRGKMQLNLQQIPPGKRTAGASMAKIIENEEKRLKTALPNQCHLVTLDGDGDPWSTIQLAGQLRQWMHLGKSITLVIGGPDGLSDIFLRCSNQRWSLSRLTFPHSLARVIVAEQLYRAFSLIEGIPYHRE